MTLRSWGWACRCVYPSPVVAWAYLILPGMGAMLVLVIFDVPITSVINAAHVLLTVLLGQWFGVEHIQGPSTFPTGG
jgi:hypothetical protein